MCAARRPQEEEGRAEEERLRAEQARREAEARERAEAAAAAAVAEEAARRAAAAERAAAERRAVEEQRAAEIAKLQARGLFAAAGVCGGLGLGFFGRQGGCLSGSARSGTWGAPHGPARLRGSADCVRPVHAVEQAQGTNASPRLTKWREG